MVTVLRAVAAALFLLAAAAVAARYPLGVVWPAIGLVAYGAALWWRPRLWLVLIPAALPTLDLAPWTGWLYLAESDMLVLATAGVLLLRAPPGWRDLAMGSVADAIIALAVIATLIGLALGLTMVPPVPGGSAIAYLQPENAWRLAKGLGAAILLLPFLRQALRQDGDATSLFAWGMLLGLGLVGLASLVERAAFVGPLDFSSDYRVVATFSSMHLGGGHVGAYIALALPFLAVGLLRPGPASLLGLLAAASLGGYGLAVSFARTAYAAALVGMVVLAVGWVIAARGRRGWSGAATRLGPVALVAVAGTALALAAGTELMRSRFAQVARDLGTREANWLGGLELRGEGVLATLFGRGLGTYPRLVEMHRGGRAAGTNFTEQAGVLSIHSHSQFYVGQKIAVLSDRGFGLSLDLRSADRNATLSAVLCEKLLLYSTSCRSASFRAGPAWSHAEAILPNAGLGAPRVLGLLGRPVELAFAGTPGTSIEVRGIRLVEATGRDALANGDFRDGMERWYFTEDAHLVWRVKNQYLMALIETGVLGVAALLALLLGATLAAWWAMRRGEGIAAMLVASLAAFSVSSVFDYLLEAPRLATVFYLVAFLALSLDRSPAAATPPRPAT